jgi:hypothetical protein
MAQHVLVGATPPTEEPDGAQLPSSLPRLPGLVTIASHSYSDIAVDEQPVLA